MKYLLTIIIFGALLSDVVAQNSAERRCQFNIDMGKPSQITRQQEAELNRQSSGTPLSTETVVIQNGRFVRKFQLRDNDIVFVKLIKLDQ